MKRKRVKKKLENQENIELFYNNINGLISKQDSLGHIVQMKKPDVITLCETKLHKNSTFDLEGYEVEKSNLKAGKEGVLVAAKEGTFCRMEKTYESEDRNIATVEINYPQDAVRFVVVHGPQEDAPQETREDFFENLMAEIERCLSADYIRRL